MSSSFVLKVPAQHALRQAAIGLRSARRDLVVGSPSKATVKEALKVVDETAESVDPIVLVYQPQTTGIGPRLRALALEAVAINPNRASRGQRMQNTIDLGNDSAPRPRLSISATLKEYVKRMPPQDPDLLTVESKPVEPEGPVCGQNKTRTQSTYRFLLPECQLPPRSCYESFRVRMCKPSSLPAKLGSRIWAAHVQYPFPPPISTTGFDIPLFSPRAESCCVRHDVKSGAGATGQSLVAVRYAIGEVPTFGLAHLSCGRSKPTCLRKSSS